MHALLHYFQVVVPTGSPWWLVFLGTVFPILSGWLSNLIMDGVRQLSAKIDAANAIVKQVISVVIAALVGYLAAHFGTIVLDPDIHNWTADALNAVLTVLAQQGIYRWKSDNQAAAQGTPTTAQRRMGIPKKIA